MYYTISPEKVFHFRKHSYLTLFYNDLFDQSRALNIAKNLKVPFEIGYGLEGNGITPHYHRYCHDTILFPDSPGEIAVAKEQSMEWEIWQGNLITVPPRVRLNILHKPSYFFLKTIDMPFTPSPEVIADDKQPISSPCIKNPPSTYQTSSDQFKLRYFNPYENSYEFLRIDRLESQKTSFSFNVGENALIVIFSSLKNYTQLVSPVKTRFIVGLFNNCRVAVTEEGG